MSGQGTSNSAPRVRRMAWLASMGLALAMPLAVGIPAAEAGQVRAQFKASLRIDARLIERDLAGLSATTTTAKAAPATTGATASTRTASSITPQRLPRADGSGICVRMAITATHFRWVCQ